MKTLKLTLKKKWFDMILSGEKKEEYREIKEYWINRLLQCQIDINKGESKYECKKASCISCLTRVSGGRFKYYDQIEFSNGYGSKVPKILIECKAIEINKGKQEWGAELNTEYFVIKLGQIVSTSNLL